MALHLRWTSAFLRSGGLPVTQNWAPYLSKGSSSRQVAAFVNAQSYPIQTWRDLESYRRLWPRPLVVKGIIHEGDARRGAEIGGAIQSRRAVSSIVP